MTRGIDEPDSRGRTGLDQVGRALTGNPRVFVTDVTVTSDGWHVLRSTTFRYRRADGEWETQSRETYDRGNGATILLFNRERRSVLLTRQFRYPVYVNGHPDGMLIETAAGLLDDDDPLTAIRREAEEETGHVVGEITPVFDLYMSPGSVTEKIHFYAAEFDADTRHSAGGGLSEEGEEIDVLELGFDEAVAGIGTSIVDAKTILLLQWAALRGPFATGPVPAEAVVAPVAEPAPVAALTPAVPEPPVPARLGRVRRVAVITVITSVTIAALIGILALLVGDVGETTWRILGTTTIIGAFSILSLCHLAVLGRDVRAVGYIGVAVSLISALLLVVQIWWDYPSDPAGLELWSQLWRWTGITAVIAVSLAHANLLLLLSARPQRAIRVILIGTLVAIAIVALMIILPIVTDGDIPGESGDTYWRWFGAVAIVDALGTIVLPVIGRVLRPRAEAPLLPRS